MRRRTARRSTTRSKRQKSEVIVIGAGLAGLACAYELAKRRHDVVVLEARNRVGGRIETLRKPFSKNFFAEAGAYWLNDRHTVAMGYIKELGLNSMLVSVALEDAYLLCHIRDTRVQAHLAPTDSWPSTLQLLPIEQQMGLGAILWSIFGDRDIVGDPRDPGWPTQDVVNKYGGMNFLEFLRSGHRVFNPTTRTYHDYTPSSGAIELIRPWFAWWDDLDKLSALAMIQYGVTGQRLIEPRESPAIWYRTKKGMDQFPLKFESKLKNQRHVRIYKQSPVVAVKQSAESVIVTYRSPSGQRKDLHGDYVVSAVPLSTLRKIRVTPSLSPSKRSLMEEVGYASIARAYVQCKKPITDMANGAGYTDLPIGNLLDMSFRLKVGPGRLLQGFMIGEQARRFTSMNEKKKRAFTLEQMRIVFPQLEDRDVERFAYKCWDKDPWAQGAYPMYSPFQFIAAEELGRSEGRLHFAGEHTSQLSAWMDGALRSGIRAAREIDPAIPARA